MRGAAAEQGEVAVGRLLEQRKGPVGSSPCGFTLAPDVMGEKLRSCWEEAADALEA